ncbi:hypothetical protein CVD28_05240 [Bacillus sp. M6-12]|uniref:sodium:solute symporter family protein n=1 Tax=Bacillus sp. M6-12 TaxID=2054166 RepID=UPI000C774775|nr:sodium:solute symporter family protein [Bacillus sp. M6-12]PLS18545.1 hypothetical protein CVD28_05240 [Bacillus sp. M6-12]
MDRLTVLIIAVVLYMGLMIWIGWYSQRKTSGDEGDYYLANRGVNTFVLFCAILGTNMSAFVMLGMAGAAYRAGAGMYGLIMGGAVLTISLFPYIFGARVWALGKKFNYYTPTEYVEARFRSPLLSILVFVVFIIYTLPYITTGQIGAGAAFANFTGGVIPFWAGSLLVTAIVGYYVWGGGMKGTAYTNVSQVVVFIVFLFTATIWISIKAGGPDAIIEKIRATNEALLHRENAAVYNWKTMFSQLLLFSICIFSMPHIYIRFMVAKNANALRKTSILYPWGILFTWVPACIIGFWGAGLMPGLDPKTSDNILFMLTGEYLPIGMFAFAVIALLAIVMSTMDAQTLTVASLFSNDILKTRFNMDDKSALKWGKAFVIIVLAISYIFSLLQPATVFQLAALSFTGTSALAPVLVAAMYWKRLNKQGAIASVVSGLILVPLYFATTLFPNSPFAQNIVATMPRYGFDPVVPVMITAFVVMVVVTLVTPKQVNEKADEQFAFLDKIYKKKELQKDPPQDVAL